MTGSVKVNGSWGGIANVSVRIGGSWESVTNGWTRISGAWKEWFSSAPTTLAKVGNLTNLGVARSPISSTTNPFSNRAVFTGGVTGNFSSPQLVADSYDENLVKQSIPNLFQERFSFPMVATTNNLIAAGGYRNFEGQGEVNFYNTNFTISSAAALSQGAYGHAGGNAGERSYFGGLGNNATFATNRMDSYNSSMVKLQSTLLTTARGGGFVNIGNSTMFHYATRGGSNFNGEFEVWNQNGSRVSTGNTGLSTSGTMQGANTTTHSIIQLLRNNQTIAMSAYNTSLVRTALADKEDPAITAVGAGAANFVLFAGGEDSNSAITSVTIYNNNLVKIIGTPLTQGRGWHGVGSAGNSVIVAGGSISGGNYGTKTNSVEAYTAQ